MRFNTRDGIVLKYGVFFLVVHAEFSSRYGFIKNQRTLRRICWKTLLDRRVDDDTI
jgi:hypothetical protein